MKRWSAFLIMAAGILAFVPDLHSDPAAPAVPLDKYLEQLQVKLEHTARRANQPQSHGSHVVGLRGSKQESASKQLYWKGKKTEAPVSVEEVKMFRGAVETARAGKTPEAIATLNSFQEKYPKSAMLPDVRETLHRLSSSTPAAATPTP
jgi:hypothetical protein